jgi:hypothetical protein
MAAAWSMWLLFELTMAQPFNNIDAMSLDPNLGVVAGSFCRSPAAAQGMRSSLASRHGDMTERELVLLGGWQADLRQGCIEDAPRSNSTAATFGRH